MWYIEKPRGNAVQPIIARFIIKDKDTGKEIPVRKMVGVRVAINRGDAKAVAEPVEVSYTKRGGWKMSFPATASSAGRWRSGAGSKWGQPELRFEEEGVKRERTVTPHTIHSLCDRLAKMCGFPLAVEVIAGMDRAIKEHSLETQDEQDS